MQYAKLVGAARSPSSWLVRACCTVLTVFVLRVDTATAQQAASTNCDGLTTASVILSETTALVFMVGLRAGHAILEVAFLARGEPGWNAQDLTFQPWLRPKLPDSTGYLTGAGVGRLFLQYEPSAKVAWINTQRRPVKPGDVLVIEQGHTDQPVIRAAVAVEPRLSIADVCEARRTDDHDVFRRSVLENVMKHPQLRGIIEGRETNAYRDVT